MSETIIKLIFAAGVFLVASLIAWTFIRKLIARVIIYDYQRGLLYKRGVFTGLLGPGGHWHVPLTSQITIVDIRAQTLSIGSQEVLSQDGVSLKISLALQYAVADPVASRHKAAASDQVLYQAAQLALRDAIGRREMDKVMEDRGAIAAELMAACKDRAAEFGLDLQLIDIKDIMFPGKLKEIYATVAQARKEGQALLEKARGETAALRHLANVAKLCEDNPALMRLRLIQALGQSSGHTVVLGEHASGVPAVNKPNHATNHEKEN